MDFPTCRLPERRHSVCVCWPRPPVSHCLSSRPRHSPCARLGRPPAVSLPSRDTYAREQTTHVFRFSLRSTSCSSVCERLINIEIGFPWEHMGTHSRAESPKKWDSSEYLQPPNCVTTASFTGRRLTSSDGQQTTNVDSNTLFLCV